MRTLAAGPGGIFPAGQVAEFDDETAEAMIASGAATSEPVGDEWLDATAEPPERAVKPRPRRRKAG